MSELPVPRRPDRQGPADRLPAVPRPAGPRRPSAPVRIPGQRRND